MGEREVGLVPGTPVLHDEDAQPTRMRLFDYGADRLHEQDGVDVATAAALLGSESVTWVDVVGLENVERITELAQAFGVHPLYVEAVVDVESRPKLVDHPEVLFLVLKMVHRDGSGAEQVSIVLGADFVLTFQEREGDVFEPVRRRLRMAGGRIRERGSDYLAFALADAVVDGLLSVAEAAEDRVEALEDEVLAASLDDAPLEIYTLKRELRFLHRLARPQRDAIAALTRSDTPLIRPRTRVYLRDVQDHLERIDHVLSSARESAAALLELHLSMVSHRMNESMHVLTVLTAMFAPPTFLAGLYGMNFRWMPELDVTLGYPLVLMVMVLASAAMWWTFRRKGWV